MARRSSQCELALRFAHGWGGRRPGAGRRPGRERRDPHRKRAPLEPRFPCLVTLKAARGLPSLRTATFTRELRRSLRELRERGDFRVVHYSLQRDHLHAVVEAASTSALARGMKALGSRLARAVNRSFRRRGRVLASRFHLRVLHTPREVRHALAYVLLNVRKHWRQRHGATPPARLDTASSGRWFDGWRRAPPPGSTSPVAERSEVSKARTWLLACGWRRHGLVDPAEVPGTRRGRGSRP